MNAGNNIAALIIIYILLKPFIVGRNCTHSINTDKKDSTSRHILYKMDHRFISHELLIFKNKRVWLTGVYIWFVITSNLAEVLVKIQIFNQIR